MVDYKYKPISTKDIGPVDEDSDPPLVVINPTNYLYERCLNYRYYRLFRVDLPEGKRHTSDFKDHKKALRSALKNNMFTGEDPILILKFLAEFTRECDAHGISEPQAYNLIPYFMDKQATDGLQSVTDGTEDQSEGGVSTWPQVVNYLLGTYATNDNIAKAVEDLLRLRQKTDESEQAYHERLLKAIARCGSVHRSAEKISIFINGLLPQIRPRVSEFRTLNPKSTLLMILRNAEAEGNAYRAQREAPAKHGSRINVVGHDGKTTRKSSHKKEDKSSKNQTSSSSSDSESELSSSDDNKASEKSAQDSKTDPTDPLNFAYRGKQAKVRNVPAPKIPGGTPTTPRPGWEDKLKVLICWHCYAKDHTRGQCTLDWADYATVVDNYNKLTEAEKLRVPAQAFHSCKALLLVATKN